MLLLKRSWAEGREEGGGGGEEVRVSGNRIRGQNSLRSLNEETLL